MKYKIGDVLVKGGDVSVNIEGVIGKVYIIIDNLNVSGTCSESEIEGYTLKTKEIPPDGTPVKVWYGDPDCLPLVRISTGGVGHCGEGIMVYSGGLFQNATETWDKWDVLK